MAYTPAVYTANGSTQEFDLSFPYIRREDVRASVNGVLAGFTWVNATRIRLNAIPAAGATVRITRKTPTDDKVVAFQSSSILTASDLNTAVDQVLFSQQEVQQDFEDLVDGQISDLENQLLTVVPKATTVTAAGLATGGGDLSASRTITVPAATQGEAEAGTSDTKAMTPLRTTQHFNAKTTATTRDLLQSASPAAFRTAVGLTVVGDALATATTPGSARSTLGVYSTGEVDAALATRLPLSHEGAGAAAHAAASTVSAGFMSAADKSKLNGIAVGATVNEPDAALRDRSTHTGTQPASSISDLVATIDSRVSTVGIPDGGVSTTKLGGDIGAAGKALLTSAAASALTYTAPRGDAQPVTQQSVNARTLHFLDFTPNGVIGTAAQNVTALNRALVAAAVAGRARIVFPAGAIPFTPGTTFNVTTSNVSFYGDGSSETILDFGATSTTAFNVTAASGVSFANLGLIATGATAGSLILFSGVNKPKLRNIKIFAAWVGVEVTGGSGGVSFQGLDVVAYQSKGVWLHDNIQGLNWEGGNLNQGGTTAGEGLVMENFSSAIRLVNVEILLGLRSIRLEAVSLGDTTSPAYSGFVDLYCDAAARESIIKRCQKLNFTNCWFSGGRSGTGYDGVKLSGNRDLVFIGTDASNCGRHGFVHDADNLGVDFIGCSATDNGQTTTNSRGFSFEAGSSRFSLIGGQSNDTSYSGGSQAFDVVLDTCDNFVVLGHNATTILDASPAATSGTILACPGQATKLPIGGGKALTLVNSGTVTWNPGSTASGGIATTYITGVGSQPGDLVTLSFSSFNDIGWLLSGGPTADGNIHVTALNLTGSTVDPASGTLKWMIHRSV